MSLVRRQSGRLANKALLPQPELPQPELPSAATPDRSTQIKPKPKKSGGNLKPGPKDTESEEEAFEDSEEESDVESDASEYGQRPATSKRQKVAVAKKSPAAKKSATVKRRNVTADSTCYLIAIPLDVLLEIFGQLEPKDIIQLSRTNHTFRSHLLANAAHGVWRKTRQNIDGPDCPADLSEQQWVHLLYGDTRCQTCGAKNIQRVDFGLRRRTCTGCMRLNLVVASSFKRRYPDLEAQVLDLIPYTNIGGFAHGHASRSQFYWPQDIEDMAEKLALHQRDIEMRIPGARKKLEKFIAERTALVGAIVKHAVVCQEWSTNSVKRRRAETARKVEQRYNAIKDRFLQLGYTENDISRIEYEASVNQPAQLTERIWNNIYPQLEPIVRKYKERRLQAARDDRIRGRTQLVDDIFRQYKKTLAPAQWRFLPGLYEIRHHPAFSAIVDAPDDMNVKMSHFDEAAAALPEFVVSWMATRKTELAQLIREAETSGPALSVTPAPDDSSASLPDTQILNLATCVFACAQPPCSSSPSIYSSQNTAVLIGWESAVAHHCHSRIFYGFDRGTSIETILEFSARGHMAATSLVTLAGLHEKRATATDMDQLDLRFVCLDCTPRTANGTKSYTGFSWRAAVSHFVTGQHAAPQWRKLDIAEAQKVKNSEGCDSTLSWSCNHCADYLDAYQTFTRVLDHVKASHSISDPIAPGDLFRHLDLPRTPGTLSVSIAKSQKQAQNKQVQNEARHTCLRCATMGTAASTRLFILSGVKSHLQAKHQVADPVQNVDWK
ncbi:hypothetical protein C8R47DRAFT_1145095 [Mycena vitilis]|nr:hypothetical protein C8R47DRAFT_1145095 [Mycena vitilis]